MRWYSVYWYLRHIRYDHVMCHLMGTWPGVHVPLFQRVPSTYRSLFATPDTKSHTEWSLIGGKNAISSFHMDTEGMATVIVVLEGRKYWIVATRIGEDDNICAADSLGPNWDSYIVNEGDNVDRFKFEAVHLNKGDML